MAANHRQITNPGSDFFYHQWKRSLFQRMSDSDTDNARLNPKQAHTVKEAKPPSARPSSALLTASSSHSPRYTAVSGATASHSRSASLSHIMSSRCVELSSPRTAASDHSGSKSGPIAARHPGTPRSDQSPASAPVRPPSAKWRAAAAPPPAVPLASPRPQSTTGRTIRPPPLPNTVPVDSQMRRPSSRNGCDSGREVAPLSPQTLQRSSSIVSAAPTTSRSLCALYHEADDHFSNGRVRAAWATLSSLQGLPEATLMSAPSLLRLPSCCDRHPLLVARLVTLVCGPAEGNDVYDRLDSGSEAGDTGERNAVASLVKCCSNAVSDSETAAHTDAAIDVFSATCRPLAVHWLLWKAARLVAFPLRLSDALRTAERAATLAPRCCHAASAVGILRVCLLGDELAVALRSTSRAQCSTSGGLYSRDSLSTFSVEHGAAQRHGAVGSCTEGERHFFCLHFSSRLRELQDLQTQLARLRLTDQMIALDDWKKRCQLQLPLSCVERCPSEHPAAIAQIERHLDWRLDLLRIRLLLRQSEQHNVVAEILDRHEETGCAMDKHLWQQLRLQSLVGCGRWREAYAITEEWERSGACSAEATLSFRLHMANQLSKTVAVCGASAPCVFAANAQPLQILGFQRGPTTSSSSIHDSRIARDDEGGGPVTGVSGTPSKSEVHRRYRQLCLVWHPDKWRGRHGATADAAATDATDVAAFCFRFIGDAYKRALDAL